MRGAEAQQEGLRHAVLPPERGTSVKWTMEKPPLCGGSRRHVHAFIRVKAYALDGSGEELFSQPYMIENDPLEK